MSKDRVFIGPASPRQEMILNQDADIAVVGGAMGSGKSYMALLYPLRYANDPYFRGIIFRKTMGEITAQGGLWEIACDLYLKVFGQKNLKIHKQERKITFPSGASVKFGFLDRDEDKLKHQGAQYTFVLFDEGTHWQQIEPIMYLHGRLRSAKAQHRLQLVITCNPDPDWEMLNWFKWYLHEDGTPDESKAGVIRYFAFYEGDQIWADTREELEDILGISGEESGIQSFTFIPATCYDNPPLLENDPNYISKLKAKPEIDVQRYLYGNWFVRPSTSGIMKREWFVECDQEPAWTEIIKTVRAFDFAGTLKSDASPSPDYTACVKMSKLKDGSYFIHEVRRTRIRYGDWINWIVQCSVDDNKSTDVIIPIDPNPAAAMASNMMAKTLSESGLFVRKFKSSSKKLDRARPFASMLMNGGVKILRNCGYDEENNIIGDLSFFYREVEAFDGERRKGELGHDD